MNLAQGAWTGLCGLRCRGPAWEGMDRCVYVCKYVGDSVCVYMFACVCVFTNRIQGQLCVTALFVAHQCADLSKLMHQDQNLCKIECLRSCMLMSILVPLFT